MRMWGVDPKILCRKHLLGEHVEMHMFVGTIKKGNSIQGYIDKGLVNPALIIHRHNCLVGEMLSRGYNHQSPLLNDLPEQHDIPFDTDTSLNDLITRCPECNKRRNNL